MNRIHRFNSTLRWGASIHSVILAATVCSAATIHVSTTGNDETGDGSLGNPYGTPAFAIAQSAAGDEVRFASGTYAIDSTIAIGHKDLALVGTAARDVVFDADNVCRILATADNYTGLVLSGITFRKGRYSDASDGGGNMKTIGGAVRLVSDANQPDWANTGSIVTNCAFENCSSAYGGGGGLFVGNGSTIVDCTFDNCTGGLDGDSMGSQRNRGGGALSASTSQADVTVLRCAFTGNVCSNGVGAVASTAYSSNSRFATNACSLVVRDCGFTNNVSYGYAGCLGLKARTVENCTFKGNECRKSNKTQMQGVPRNGGGVFAPEQANADLTVPQTVRYSGCRFEDNKSLADNGGGVFHVGGAVLVEATNCVFTGNTSALYGDVFYGADTTADGGLAMYDCIVSNNYSSLPGDNGKSQRLATINVASSTGILRLVRTKFTRNRQAGSAGTVFACPAGSQVIDCEFRANETTRISIAPATVHFEPYAANVLVRGCLFASNTNNASGGSCLRFGGFNYDGSGCAGCVVENCTFAGNRTIGSTGETTGAICFRNSATSDFIVRNCVFWDNHSMANATLCNFAIVNDNATAAAASYCWEDGSQLVTGTRNNIAGGTAPKFADAANGDWTPTASSPWVNRGQNQSWMASAFDLRNDKHFPRLNGVVDMGCYEYSPLNRGLSIFVR